MLTSLSIRNVVLIEALDLNFAGGLGVLTGETGAGKSILLDALGLILGDRADSGLVRAGEDQASVTATFEFDKLPPAIRSALTDAEIDDLIFAPGFSTAATISDVSGRGVGMDVVRRSIQALGGRITISSRPGNGTTFSLSLPLTLAVLDGMVVTVAGQTLVVPLSAIVETLQPKAADVHGLGEKARVIAIRGSFIPLVDVGSVLGYRDEEADPLQGVAVMVETENQSQCALMVDGIIGQQQVVIKSLETNYGHVFGVAAATILGDGRVAVILDVDAIVAGSRSDVARADANRKRNAA